MDTNDAKLIQTTPHERGVWLNAWPGFCMAELSNASNYGNRFKTGISFFDDAGGGIYPVDLIILTAGTGIGKTQLAVNMALNCCKADKKVHYFALEGHVGEIETRIKYRVLAEKYFSEQFIHKEFISQRKYLHGELHETLLPFDTTACMESRTVLKNLFVYYKSSLFDVETFIQSAEQIRFSTDLIIIDHLQYMDFDGKDEIRDLTFALMKIRDTALELNKPIILISHIRKKSFVDKRIIPDLDDLYGSSNITKIATKVFTIAPAKTLKPTFPHLQPTYCAFLKNRMDGSVHRYVAIHDYDIRKNAYSSSYKLAFLSNLSTEFEPVEKKDVPEWAQHASPD